MEVVKVLVVLTIGGAQPMPVAVVPSLEECRKVVSETQAANEDYTIEGVCVPMPLKAIIAGEFMGKY